MLSSQAEEPVDVLAMARTDKRICHCFLQSFWITIVTCEDDMNSAPHQGKRLNKGVFRPCLKQL